MSIALKAGIGGVLVCGVGVTCVTMYVLAKPSCVVIADNNNEGYSGKFGEDFKYHLVSATNANNTKWWDWVFKNVWGEDTDSVRGDGFKSTDVTEAKKLKEQCKAAYGKVTKTEIHATNKEAYEKSVWKYCSVGNKKPVVVKDAKEKEEGAGENDTTKIGKANEGKLISTKDKENDWFWEIQEKAFFKKDEQTNTGIGSKATEESSEFKKLYDKTNRGENDTLRKTCESVYKKENSDATHKKDALVFCSLQAAGDQ